MPARIPTDFASLVPPSGTVALREVFPLATARQADHATMMKERAQRNAQEEAAAAERFRGVTTEALIVELATRLEGADLRISEEWGDGLIDPEVAGLVLAAKERALAGKTGG